MPKKRTSKDNVDKGEAIRLANDLLAHMFGAVSNELNTRALLTLEKLHAAFRELYVIAQSLQVGYALNISFAMITLKRANVDAEISVIIRERTA